MIERKIHRSRIQWWQSMATYSSQRLWFACDVGRYINSFWLIDWLIVTSKHSLRAALCRGCSICDSPCQHVAIHCIAYCLQAVLKVVWKSWRAPSHLLPLSLTLISSISLPPHSPLSWGLRLPSPLTLSLLARVEKPCIQMLKSEHVCTITFTSMPSGESRWVCRRDRQTVGRTDAGPLLYAFSLVAASVIKH